jgi:hypothetical protein
MSVPDNEAARLPDELERALQRATVQTLASLGALRKALRAHVHKERDDGATLMEIERDLRMLVSRAEGSSSNRADGDGNHDHLATQLVKWSEGFYDKPR